MTRDRSSRSLFPAVILLLAVVASPLTSRGAAVSNGSLEVDFSISAITSSLSGPLTSVPTDLSIVGQTDGSTSTSIAGNASASASGTHDVVSSGSPVGDGPAPILLLGDGFTLSSLVSASADLPSGTASAASAQAGAVSFQNNSTVDSFTIEITINAIFNLSATTGADGSSSTGFTINTVQGNTLIDTYTQSATSPNGSNVGSRQLVFTILLDPGQSAGIGVGAGIGASAAVVPEPSSAASAVIGAMTLLGYGTWRRRARGRRVPTAN